MAQSARYRIHPAIGIGRLGNASASTYFVGPEQPGQPVTGVRGLGTTVPSFKSGGLVKRQAARFRVWEYRERGGIWSPSREINLGEQDVVELTWTVHLANRKASFYKFEGLIGSSMRRPSPVTARARRNALVTDRRSLEIDPLPRSIGGANKRKEIKRGGSPNASAERWPTPQPVPSIEDLGEIRTDDRGRLVVVPPGAVVGSWGGPITDYANNDGWFDDACDGPVTVKLRLRLADGTIRTVSVQSAWMMIGPPDFAPDLPQTVSLYDLLFDLAARAIPIPADESLYRTGELSHLAAIAKDLGGGSTTLRTYKVDFDKDVASILRQTLATAWVFEDAQFAHTTLGAGSTLAALWPTLADPAQPTAPRLAILSRLRTPGTPGAATTNMPKLLGDDPRNQRRTMQIGLSLTVTQYAILTSWAAGNFSGSALPPSSLLQPPVPTAVTPHGLDQAALANASGGAFFPGIEVGWQIRDPSLFAEPFRIRIGALSRYVGDPAGTAVGAGYFSRQLALPWLADFLECSKGPQPLVGGQIWGWWPSQRPDDVYPNADEAKNKGAMVPWHRATVGASSDWPPDSSGPDPRPATMPSYRQMLANWWKLGVVVLTPGKGFAESDRNPSVP